MGNEKNYGTLEPSEGIEIVANGGKIVYAGPVRKGFLLRHRHGLLTAAFLISFSVSGYFFFQQPFEDKPEFLVAPLTMLAAILAARQDKQLIFLPAFILGAIWALTALIFDSVTFDIATYVFSYCVSITLLFLTAIIKR